MTAALPWLGAGALGMIGAALLLLRMTERENRVRARVAIAVHPETASGASLRPPHRLGMLDLVARLGAWLAHSGWLPAATRVEFERTLAQGGWGGSRGIELFIGGKVLLTLGLPALLYLGLESGGGISRPAFIALLGGGAVVGLLLPDFVLRQIRARYLRQCERGLPDALDMLVICTQAGLALEAAIERVALEFAFANRAVSEELGLCASEMMVGSDRRRALLGMGERTGLDSLKRFGATLVQTLQFGTPLSQALRVLAAEMRQDMLTRFEERAARLPVLLTFPMILFILPCVFIVVGGPAAIRVAHIFTKV